NLPRLPALLQRGEHLLVLQYGLIERATRFRVRREAVPDYLVLEQIAAFNIRVRTQDLIRDLLQLGIGLSARSHSLRSQVGALPELLLLLHGIRKGLVRVADDHGTKVSCEVHDQKSGDHNCEESRHQQPHLPTMRCYGFRKSWHHDLKRQGPPDTG